MPDFPIQFDRPEAFLLLLFIVPVLWIGWRRLTGMSPVRRGIVCGARVLVILLIAITIAQPKWLDRGEALSVIMLIDRSRSISPQLERQAIEYLTQAAEASENRRPIDRVAIIDIGKKAHIRQLPEIESFVDPGTPVIPLDATNLADGLNKALAIAPQDTATRILLVSDGNENVGSALAEAGKIASNNIPVDILRLTYEYQNDVMFDRIAAPSVAREGQNVPVNLVLRSLTSTTGTLSLTMDGEPIDLDPGGDGYGVRVALDEGVNTRPVTLYMDEAGAKRLRAEFRPDDPDADERTMNNVAEAVTIVQGEGRVLLVQETIEETQYLLDALREAEIDVEIVEPAAVTSDVVSLSSYDSIIIPNIPAHAFSVNTLEALRRYVHDVGGGLVMVGGPSGFGAGGWIDTPVEKALPVKLDPPDMERMPKGALVCIMHSTEIPQGNYWGAQCASAAIQALSRLDMAGVIDFNPPGDFQGCAWEFPLQELGDKRAALAAIKKMPMGDMPDFTPSMRMALDALTNANASQKHVIVVSDGDPQPPSGNLLAQFRDARITISTVVSGGHGTGQDAQTMKRIAQATGGEYYNPGNNFAQMPKIFWKESIRVRRSLIQEGETYTAVHQPNVRPGPFRGQWTALPGYTGYVLTHARDGYAPEILTNKGDPLFSSWQYGLGKAAVYTSDATARWGSQWVSWSEYRGFWEQIVRWSMRPAAPSNVELNIRLDGQTAIVEAELLTGEGQYATFGKMEGVVLTPSLEAKPITLQQTGPGRGRAEFQATEPGSWVVNLLYDDPEVGRRSIQAGMSIPYSQEFRTVRDNTALLRELSHRTNGREMPDDPTQAELFERAGLDVPLSMTDLWTLIASLAASMVLLDVATRRLAIDREAVRRRWYELWNRRKIEAEASIGRLKTTRAGVRERATASGGAEEVEEARRAGRGAAGARFEAQQGEASLSVEEMASEAGGPSEDPARKKAKSARPAASTDDQPSEEGESMSRLLAAKRRAREERDQQRGGDSSNPSDADDQSKGGADANG